MLRAANRPILAYFEAIKALRVRQVATLLKAGYDPNLLVNARGQNGLQFMIGYFAGLRLHGDAIALNKAAYLAIGRLLLGSGLDPNAADLLTGETAIFDAIRCNDKDMVALLLNYVDLSVRNKNGETALMCAARFGGKQVMRLILEHLRQLDMDGYFLRQRNRLGMTALELARAENLECAKVLAKHLIAHGHHATHAVLARSASHHQLLAQSRLAPYLHRLAEPESDLDAAELLSGPCRPAPPLMAYRGAPRAAYYAAATAADPKAVEFNQYLLEQHELGAGERAPLSSDDDDDYNDGLDAGYLAPGPAGGPGGMTRSRSCILASSQAAKAAQANRKQLDANAKPSAASSWDLAGSRGGARAAP